jgi:hypothetical protein
MSRTGSTPRGAYRGATYFNNVPEAVRRRIDNALIHPTDDCKCVIDVYRRFRLKEDYDVGMTTFREYARRLLRNERMQSIGQIASGLCPAPDPTEENELHQRGHLLVIQHIVRSLQDSELSTSELCSLARAYATHRKLALDMQRAPTTQPTTGAQSTATPADDDRSEVHTETIARLVREIYGARLPETDTEQAAKS